jgi:glycosyltransferase involved in cell wall biosynthesis
MSRSPILSICIPTYNRPLWFRRALESIINCNKQYSSQVEVIVTDDSDDQKCEEITEEVLSSWSGRWQYEHHQSRLGMVANWNRSIDLATGSYLLILHDDDFLLRGAIGTIVEGIEQFRDTYPVLLFGVEVVDERERVMKRQVFRQNQFLPPREALIELLSNSSFVRFPAMVMGRKVFEEVGVFDAQWREPCDLQMWIRLFDRYGVCCLPQVTAAYTVHSQALTMGMFNKQTVDLLLGLFKEVARLNILNPKEIESCKALFFHQFILAGAFRQFRRGHWQEFQQVMGLFDLSGLQGLSCPRQWWLFRFIFRVLTYGLRFVRLGSV